MKIKYLVGAFLLLLLVVLVGGNLNLAAETKEGLSNNIIVAVTETEQELRTNIPDTIVKSSKKVFLIASLEQVSKEGKVFQPYYGSGYLFAPGMVKTAFHVVARKKVLEKQPLLYLIVRMKVRDENNIDITGYKLSLFKKDEEQDLAILKIDKFFEEIFSKNENENELEQFKFGSLKETAEIPSDEEVVYTVGFKQFSTGEFVKFIFRNKIQRVITVKKTKLIILEGFLDPVASGGVVMNERGEVFGRIIGILQNPDRQFSLKPGSITCIAVVAK